MLPPIHPLALRLEQAAINAGRYLAQERARFDDAAIEYKGLNDLVSYVDREAERRLVAELTDIYPEARFITEEGTTETRNDGRTAPQDDGAYWIIDPLDGTTNFIHDLGVYAVSVGLMVAGELVAGAIYDPTRQESFLAWQSGGAYLNGTRIRVSQAAGFGQSLLATGFPYQRFDHQAAYLAVIDELMRNSHGLRRMGSAAIDLAYVAAARFDGFFEYNLKAWDAAAGIILVREAGGVVTDFSAGPDCLFGGQLVAGGAAVHQALQILIADKWKG